MTSFPSSSSGSALSERAYPVGLAPVHALVVESAQGASVRAVDGREYLDFAGGIGCVNVGHAHPRVVAAIREQAGRALHTAAALHMHDLYAPVCEQLNNRLPGDHAKRTFLTNSGTEAVENAIRIARAFTGRPAVVSFAHAFHGRTALAATLSGDPQGPAYVALANDVYRVPYPHPYRGAGSAADVAASSLNALKKVCAEVGEDRVAAVIIEPIQGEGGFVIPPPGFLASLREFCTRRGIVLIADEIQTGFARTGSFFAHEGTGLEPDLVLSGKSIADGLPLAAVTGRADVMDALPPGGLGGTYGGNPVACAAALAVLDIIDDEGLVERAQHIGSWIAERTKDYPHRFAAVGEVRIAGAMAAIELVSDQLSKEPATATCASVVRRCADRGLLVLPAGPQRNVLRLLGPLTLNDEQLDQGFSIIEEVLEASNE